MRAAVEMILQDAGQLLTLAGNGPRQGPHTAELGLIQDGAVAPGEGRVVAVGATTQIKDRHRALRKIDARGRGVLIGFFRSTLASHLRWLPGK